MPTVIRDQVKYDLFSRCLEGIVRDCRAKGQYPDRQVMVSEALLMTGTAYERLAYAGVIEPVPEPDMEAAPLDADLPPEEPNLTNYQ
jgi:hypothetical protein